MSKRISDTEAEQLLAGMTPAGHPELTDLAAAIGGVRARAEFAAAPVPTAMLLARLEGKAIVPISITGEATVASRSTAASLSPLAVRRAALIEGVRKMFEWIAGIGLASKITIGAGVVLLATTGVGAAGALPGPAQSAFDTIVSTVTGTDDDSAPYVDDESDVDDDPAPYVDDESDVDDDPAPYVEDESDVNDDPAPYVEDESDVNDDPAPYVEDESDVNDDSAPYVEDESDVNDDSAPYVEDESDSDDGPVLYGEDGSADED